MWVKCTCDRFLVLMATEKKGLSIARSILEKYGWKEGKGLGRKENGIVKALKPILKFDNAGFGHSGISEQFTSRWWEQAYNNIAKKITVEKSRKNICVGREFTEDKSKSRHACPPVAKYDTRNDDSFIKKSVLTKEESIQMSALSSPDAISKDCASAVSPITDEEIFWACEGRTVHKGARHGLKLNGKLARIQRQEHEYLQKFHGTKSSLHVLNDQEAACVSKKRKGKTHQLGRENKTDSQVQCNSISHLPVSKSISVTKKNKKSRKPDMNEDSVSEKKRSEIEDTEYSVFRSNARTDCTSPFVSHFCSGISSEKMFKKSEISLVEDASCSELTQCLKNEYNEDEKRKPKKISKGKKRFQNSEDSGLIEQTTTKTSYFSTIVTNRYENSETEYSNSSNKKLKRIHRQC